MVDSKSIDLEIQKDEGVVIRLGEIQTLIERLSIRFGLSAKEIAKHLRLRERSVLKIMNLNLTREYFGK